MPAVAYAESDAPDEIVRHIGEITAVDVNQEVFSLHTRKGENLRIHVNEETRFVSRDSSIQSLADLEVGMLAYVSAYQASTGSLIAKVVAAGEGEHLPKPFRVHGTIKSAQPGASTFKLDTREGETITFDVNERTRFRGEGIEDLSDLKPGMAALVVAVEVEEGKPLAILIAAGDQDDLQERFRALGEVIEVDLAEEQFSMTNRDGERLTITVNERTSYRGDGISGLSDLEPGMKVAVAGVVQEDGTLLARVVGAAYPEDLPETHRVKGLITSMDDSAVTLETEEGRTWTFAVVERTSFRGEGIDGLEDLEIGMQALIVGAETEEHGLIALLIAAGFRDERPGRPSVDVRVVGTLVNLGDNSFTVETRDGNQVGFHVDETTVYLSRDGQVTSFADLETGMIVAVGGKETDGGILALYIGAMDPSDRGFEREPQRSPDERPDDRPGQDDQQINL
jgi:hypothetical protein